MTAQEPRQPEVLYLPRLLRPGLRYVFIGFNPGIESARLGHYYAFRGNVFWRQLYASGLVDSKVDHTHDRRLFDEEGIGFTDICPRPTTAADELTKNELHAGALRLFNELLEHRPGVAIFAGRGVYREFARHALGVPAASLAGRPDGAQPESLPAPAENTTLFVMPSSSGLASRWHRERLELLRQLAVVRA